ncbi:phosphoribosyltransferase [Novosphingobium nitrogenifigens DSM 19370]|uniref:Phosphoribosyltransferase n=1 Tax=Novosphingobium nitrogenifigens DSM 19370 TaxID=983920 RepID=F1Z999_9SPHN|nr:ComF family protein [Novosphingobium nitrogenifigens]EGD58814.1 phosphoribosyltransferase [Novosphingobium nitrogenifigens DSM 19370]
MNWTRHLAPIIDLVFPPRCPLCGAALAQHGGLCVECWGGLAIPGEPACSQCQRPLPDRIAQQGADAALATADAARGAWVCAPCMARPPRHEGIAAATLYNEASRRLIMAFKHGRRIGLGPLLVRLMVPRVPRLEGEWLVVPVPLHRMRLWQRGFNQSAVLAKGVATALRQPLVVDALVRPKPTPPLGHLGGKQRERLLAGTIRVNARRAARLKGANVLLIDDVLTSGATTNACMAALHRAGAARVRIACFARVVDETHVIASGVALAMAEREAREELEGRT